MNLSCDQPLAVPVQQYKEPIHSCADNDDRRRVQSDGDMSSSLCCFSYHCPVHRLGAGPARPGLKECGMNNADCHTKDRFGTVKEL